MRIIKLILISLFISFNTHASHADSTCKRMSAAARVIMESRQIGISITKSLSNNSSIDNEELKSMLDKLVITAYKKPKYMTKKMQNNSIVEFENEVYLSCFDAILTK